jgi:hypothetical protein
MALNSAAKMTSRSATTGGASADRLSREASTHFATEYPLPSGSIRSPVSALKRSYLAQALIDVAALLVGLVFFIALVGSIPLAILLMVFGVI